MRNKFLITTRCAVIVARIRRRRTIPLRYTVDDAMSASGPLADMPLTPSYVRFWGGKADIAFRQRTVRLGSRLDDPFNRQRMPPDMNKHEDVAKALKIRLSELTSRVAEIDNELRKPLSADSEDQATDLENQDALGGIEYSGLQEIRQIKEALERIAKGTYGVCAQCGTDIDPKRLRALPNATRCISCAR